MPASVYICTYPLTRKNVGRLHLEERCPIVHRFLDLPSAVAACGGFAILVINVAAIAYATQVYSMLCLYSPNTYFTHT